MYGFNFMAIQPIIRVENNFPKNAQPVRQTTKKSCSNFAAILEAEIKEIDKMKK